jgi:hypothetical protein
MFSFILLLFLSLVLALAALVIMCVIGVPALVIFIDLAICVGIVTLIVKLFRNKK